jgi:hypothetical protein
MSFVGGWSELDHGRPPIVCHKCNQVAVYFLDIAKENGDNKMNWIRQLAACRTHLLGAGTYL